MERFDTEAVLETERLLLEPLRRKHAIALYSLLQDERIYQYIPQDPPISLKTLEKRYQRLETRRSPDETETWLNWAVYLKERKVYAGYVEATLSANYGQIAYIFSSLHWNQGYAYEACQSLIINLRNYDITEIMAEVDTRNTPSILLLEKLGFIKLNTHHNVDFFKGSHSDEYVYKLRELSIVRQSS